MMTEAKETSPSFIVICVRATLMLYMLKLHNCDQYVQLSTLIKERLYYSPSFMSKVCAYHTNVEYTKVAKIRPVMSNYRNMGANNINVVYAPVA